MIYRNRRLLDLAHEINDCQMRIDGVCIGYSPDGCEPAHSNEQRHGKGAGIKANDVFHVAACHPCHVEFDQGRRLTGEQRRHIFAAGFERTVAEYWRLGLVRVAR